MPEANIFAVNSTAPGSSNNSGAKKVAIVATDKRNTLTRIIDDISDDHRIDALLLVKLRQINCQFAFAYRNGQFGPKTNTGEFGNTIYNLAAH